MILNKHVGAKIMVIGRYQNKNILKVFFLLIIYLVLSFVIHPVFAHGPKGHGGKEFTALMAVKKGVELYDRLVASSKLDGAWETELTDLKVFTRNINNKKEIVVQFNRTTGEPRSVYIFFSEKGEYNGSNFTGE